MVCSSETLVGHTMTDRGRVERSSGNVFTDLDFSGAVVGNLMLRAQLMSQIREVVRGTMYRVGPDVSPLRRQTFPPPRHTHPMQRRR